MRWWLRYVWGVKWSATYSEYGPYCGEHCSYQSSSNGVGKVKTKCRRSLWNESEKVGASSTKCCCGRRRKPMGGTHLGRWPKVFNSTCGEILKQTVEVMTITTEIIVLAFPHKRVNLLPYLLRTAYLPFQLVKRLSLNLPVLLTYNFSVL